ncbi:MAG: LD-carboxypeptidase, partial [archaeon]
SNAIHAKTGLITYSGPHFSTFGMLKGLDYTIEYFKKCLMEKEPFEAAPSKEWSDDKWYIDQKKREFIENSGFRAMNTGEAKGKIIGGNLSTFNLLQGTEFMPDLRDSILFLEDDSASNPATFDRGLQSILHLPEFEGVKCLAIGRFQKESGITKELLEKIIRAKKELSGVPVVSEVDFGHTSPQITFPIGGTARISAGNGKNKIEMLEH